MQKIKKSLMVLFIMGVSVMVNAEIIIPLEGWRVNTFQKKDSGAKLTFEKAPDGSNAVIADFFGKGKANVVWPEIKVQAPNWPETFNGFSGYYWNDGNPTILRIHFSIKAGMQFIAILKLEHKGWKQIKITKVRNYRDKSGKIKFIPKNVTVMFFERQNKDNVKIGIGKLVWDKPF